MAVNWLKGLVAPAAQFAGSQQGPYPGQPAPDAPPIGGYVPQPMPPGAPPAGGGLPDPSQWQVGTRTQGSASAGQGAGGLEARCAQLTNDVASLALFARTLLTMLEEAKVVTREQFVETKNRLDALDGKLDDR